MDVARAFLGSTTRRSLLIGGRYNEWVAYPASAVGEAQPSRSFALLENDYLTNDFSLPALDREHGQLLGVVGAESYSLTDDAYTWQPRYVAYSSSGETQAPYPVSPIVSWRGRPPPINDIYDAPGRLVRVNAVPYDSARDEVLLAVKDCLVEIEEGLEVDFEHYSDCRHDLRSYPRTGGTAYTTLELPEEVHALAYDSRNDMLMLSGQASVMFVDRSKQRGESMNPGIGTDAGIGLADSSSVIEPTYQFPLAGTFQYCD